MTVGNIRFATGSSEGYETIQTRVFLKKTRYLKNIVQNYYIKD